MLDRGFGCWVILWHGSALLAFSNCVWACFVEFESGNVQVVRGFVAQSFVAFESHSSLHWACLTLVGSLLTHHANFGFRCCNVEQTRIHVSCHPAVNAVGVSYRTAEV